MLASSGDIGAPILPRQKTVPGLPAWIALSRCVRLPGQPEIADRNQTFAGAVMCAITICEGVKLLDVPQRMMGLALDPGSEPDLERPMARLERAGGQRFGVLDRKDARLLPGDGHDDRGQLDWDGVMIGFGQGLGCPHTKMAIRRSSSNDAHYGMITPRVAIQSPVGAADQGLASGTNPGCCARQVGPYSPAMTAVWWM
jgi:hypothetical protein